MLAVIIIIIIIIIIISGRYTLQTTKSTLFHWRWLYDSVISENTKVKLQAAGVYFRGRPTTIQRSSTQYTQDYPLLWGRTIHTVFLLLILLLKQVQNTPFEYRYVSR